MEVERVSRNRAETILDNDIPNVVLIQRIGPEIGAVDPSKECASPRSGPGVGSSHQITVCSGIMRHETDHLAVWKPIRVADGEITGRDPLQWHIYRRAVASRDDDRIVRAVQRHL